MITDGYRALREGVAWFDLSARGRIFVRGEDRARLLHAMTTNHVQELQPGEGCYAFFLNAQGRILSDVNILCLEDALLLDVEPEAAARIYQHLDKFIIADDVTLEDAATEMPVLGVEGPQAAELLTRLGAPVPEAPYANAHWGASIVAQLTSTGAAGFRIFVPAAESEALVARFEQAGAIAASEDDQRTVRLEHGVPRYGSDITEKNLVHETQLLHAVHFTKGCYLGQEIVERVRSRGHVNRLLVPIAVDAPEPPSQPSEVAEITSSAWSPALGKVVALAYVRADHAKAGTRLHFGDVEGEVLKNTG